MDTTDNNIENGTDNKPAKKGRLIGAIKAIGVRIYETFKDYPATMIAIITAAFIGAVRIGDNFLSDNHEEALWRIISFCLIFAVQALFYEEIFKNKNKVRICGYAASLIISAFCVFVFFCENETLFSQDTDTVIEITARYLITYGVILTGFTLHHMYRRLEDDFEVYCTKTFLALIKASVVYGLFAIGLAIIVLIFNELIFKTHDFIWQLELFLSGGIFAPMCLKAISGRNEKPGKFARLCIVYVLQPMLIISFAIIYIYIIKIFVTDSVPSNQVFNILAFLFAIGMPIWTMIHGMREDDTFLAKAAVFLPYVYVPFIGLQAWSMGIRIKSYGFTASRYSALVFMILETVYFILYLIRHIGKVQTLSWILFAIMAAAVLGLLIPWTSYDDVIIRSQMKRMDELIGTGNLTEKAQSSVRSAYSEIRGTGYKGRAALENKYSEKERDEIEHYSGYSSWEERIYINWRNEDTEIDVSEYRTLRKVREDLGSDDDLNMISFRNADPEHRYDHYFDTRELMDWIGDNYHPRNQSKFSLEGHEMWKLDESTDLCITYLSVTYNTGTREPEHISIGGYIMCR